jgi:uncharacterized protein (TIGR01777 family)
LHRGTIILPGGAGYLGKALAQGLLAEGFLPVILSRGAKVDDGPVRYLRWDGERLDDWADEFEDARAVINLAGRTVNCRYNEVNKAEIFRSRLASTKVVGEAIAGCRNPPPVWLNASSATIYRDADRSMDEHTGEIGDGFSVEVCRKWEAEFERAVTPATRKVALRMAMVFGPGKGGVFEAFHNIVRLGLGGTLGGGGQYVSWIHLDDFIRAVVWLIENEDFSGPVNLSSPNPLTNRDFMAIFRALCGQPIGLPATAWMLEIGAFFLRTETELLLKSRRVVPARLLDAGFSFEFPDFAAALEDILDLRRSRS